MKPWFQTVPGTGDSALTGPSPCHYGDSRIGAGETFNMKTKEQFQISVAGVLEKMVK